MGKSEIVPMPIHRQDSLLSACKGVFKMPEVQTVGEEDEEEQLTIPDDMRMFTNQVAGHTNDGRSIGMIKYKNTVLKPITNPKRGLWETEFYERLATTTDQDLVELRDFVPKYYGTTNVAINGQQVECLRMEDLTEGYKEPCVMDIKIGRRTWDPDASPQKVLKENMKYQDCKRDLGFCIPGFQVYKVYNHQLCKFDKEFGMKLNKDTVRQALKTFLNAESGFCRSLLVQFLASLWRIQLWARKQRHLHLFSSSLLLVYDAKRLRDTVKADIKPRTKLNRSTSLYRPLSLAVLNGSNERVKVPTGFSGQLTKDGPILRAPPKYKDLDVKNNHNHHNGGNRTTNVWQKSIRILRRTHSFQNNYDKDLQCRKQDYNSMLDDLCYEQKSEMWAAVKMIDFAHAYPAENHEIDKNYLEGVDNLIKIFEEFLVECD